MNIRDAYMVGVLVSLLGGGIYGSYVGFKKGNNFEDVVLSCLMGAGLFCWVGILSPVIIPGYLIKKISNNIE